MPLTAWATHVLQWRNKGKREGDLERIPKITSQFGDYTKLESLVIANQHVAVNTFPGLVHTARHTMGVSNARSQRLNLQRRELPKAGLMTGVKS